MLIIYDLISHLKRSDENRKAGKTGTLRSMHIYLEKYHLPAGVRISQLYFNKSLPIISLPFYAINMISRFLKC